jgi:hypothetical protein
MAVHTITSAPRPSIRHSGYHFAYYDRVTPTGKQCVVAFPASLADTVKLGFQFDEAANVHWDDTLKTSVLHLDFDELEGLAEPSLPPDPECGWGDIDCPAASAPEPEVELTSNSSNGHATPAANGQPGMRGPAHRKAEAQKAIEQGAQLPAAYLKINLEVSRSFLLQLRLIGNAVGEHNRAMIAQKLCAISSIPYYKQIGVNLTEEDINNMTAL